MPLVKKPAEPPTPGPPPAILAPNPLTPSTFTDGLPLPKLIVFDLDYTLWPFWIDTHACGPLKSKDGGTKAVDRIGESFAFYPDVPSILASCPSSTTLSLASRTQAPDLATSLLKILHVPVSASSSERPGLRSNASSSTNLRSLASPTKSSFRKLQTPASSALPTPTSEFALSSSSSSGGLVTPLTPGDAAAGNNGMLGGGGGGLGGKKAPTRRALDFFSYGQIYPGDKKGHFAKIQKASGGVPFEETLFFDDEVRNRNVEGLGVTMWLVRDGVTRDEVDEGVREWRRRRGRVGGYFD